jgi:hypothetical protein
MGLMIMFANFDDNADINKVPIMTLRQPLWKRLIIYMLVPILVLVASINQLIKPKANNGIKNA